MSLEEDLVGEDFFEIYYIHPVHTDWWRCYDEKAWTIDQAMGLATSVADTLNTKTEIVRVKVVREVLSKEEIESEFSRIGSDS